MARIRTIKPEFWKHEDLADLEAITRLLFIGLWGIADVEGRLEDRPKRIKVECLPYDDCDIEAMLQVLHDRGFIVRYVFDSKPYIWIPSLKSHQVFQKKEKDAGSKLPRCPDQPENDEGSYSNEEENESGNLPGTSPKDSGNSTGSAGKEEGKEGKGNDVRKGKEMIQGRERNDLPSRIIQATSLPSPYVPLTEHQATSVIDAFALVDVDESQLAGELLNFQDFYTRHPSKATTPNAYAALNKWFGKVQWRRPPKTAPPKPKSSPGLVNPAWEQESGNAA